ncbi:MAG TPA: [protein-PII] uridylyltransferase [Pseudonocardiaceae bacterium]|jgi:[protein-PII] uridylyltransferase|nr:[protein-PII] uridylyltransferase [Pseudonocardiaceae bacterium]
MNMPGSSAEDLLWARDLLINPPAGRRRLIGADLRAALVDLHDFWLAGHATRAGITGGGVALLAVGALGRKEFVPYSDLDLVLVHDGRDEVAGLAEQLWYPLWNAGIGLDHSVRTVRQSLNVAGSDLRAALGLLEARLITGDAEVAQRLVSSTRQAWRVTARGRLDELVESATARWARSGEVAQRVEPDLKHGRGGLRDLQLLDSLAVAQFVDRPGGELLEAKELLLDVRTELRRVVGRARDILRAQDGDEVAAALGLADRFELAGKLSSAGRSVAYAVDVAIRTVRAATPRRTVVPGLRRQPVRRPLDEGVVLHGAEVALARDVDPARDPALLLRLAAAAARANAPIAPATMSRLADRAPELRKPWPKSAREALFSLLTTGAGLVDVVEALDRTGLWGRLFPEWGAVRDLPPRDAVHVWTVDRHLIQATVQAGRLATTVSRPDLLLLGALLHDIGKGRDADHSVVGAAIAAQVGERIGLAAADVEILSGMVAHHLLLPHTATRRDVADPATVHRIVDTLGGNLVLLELLGALTEADSLATGPGMWTDWKAGLVAELVANCRTVLAGSPPPGPEPLTRAQQELADSAAASGKLGVLISGNAPDATVTIVAPDRTGLLARAAGVLALNSLQVHAATLRSHHGIAVDVFGVSPRFGQLPDPALLREQLARALDGSLPLAERLLAKEQDYAHTMGERAKPHALWFDDEATGAIVLELRAADRIGLLYRIATALEECGADVRWARVATPGATAVSSFCLATEGEPKLDPKDCARIEEHVLAAAR